MAELIDIVSEKERALNVACAHLGEGSSVAIPTETVYGLAADATNPEAISSIYEVKGRPRFNPLIAHMADLEMAKRYAIFDPVSEKLAKHFWPGPLTLVLPLSNDSTIHPLCTAGLETAGIRVPQGFAADLISQFGRPLAAPSANRSGRISPTSAIHVMEDIGERISLVLDGGTTTIGVESTIIKVEGEDVRLLRPGGLSAEDIESFLGRKLARSDHAAAIEAPGMLASHYAPESGVRLDAHSVGAGEVLINFANQAISGREHALTAYDLSPTGNLREAAANLFSFMKQADRLGAKTIAFAPVPETGLGEAINDRIRRAAAPKDQ